VLAQGPESASARPAVTAAQIEADWFHQDEVRGKAVASPPQENLARPAASAADKEVEDITVRTIRVIERGLALAENLRTLGADIEQQVARLEDLAGQIRTLSESAGEKRRRELYLQARWTVRRMALTNPLLNFDTILFAKAVPGRFPHICDQYYGWWSRPGGGIFLLSGFRSDAPHVQCLTAGWAPGSFLRPELSYDGRKVLFSYCKYYSHVADLKDKADKSNVPEHAFYHIFEMNIDGTGCRQLTRGRYDDFDARYLPSGEIVFLSTRKGLALQCSKASAGATRKQDLPDSYVRCGGDNYRPVPVFTLHRMDAQGTRLHPLSAFENFEWNPAVANDGRILYARWDYIDRFNGHFFSLWSTNTDGTNPQLVYGNFTVRPQAVLEARPIPNSRKLIFTASAHHSITGGSLVLLDRTRGTEGFDPLVRLTPEVPFPETEAWADTYYANPYPLSEEHYLVCWSDRRLPPHCRVDDSDQNPTNATGLYLYDAFGNLNLLYRDANISAAWPIPVRPREKPPAYADSVDWDGLQEGKFLLQDIYRGLEGIERGAVHRLRIVGVPPKTQPRKDSPNLGVSKEEPGKFLLGTVPVEEDGSAYFHVPSGVPVFFQAIDSNGLAVQTMRTLTYVQPGQTLGCIGCHESRNLAPGLGPRTMASQREASRLTTGPSGSWPLRFDKLVQPVLDNLCVRCHGPDSPNPEAAGLDLTAANSYKNLLLFADKDLENLAFEKDNSVIGQCPARKSRLLAMLTNGQGHEGVRLDADSFNRLVTWMDLYAQRQGSFSAEQEEDLREFRRQVASLLAE
jgi:hypothetical protein